MTPQQFKTKVLAFLKEKNIDIGNKRVRVYKYRGILEVRIYREPQEFPNSKKSFRRSKNEDGSPSHYGYSGIFSRKISMYTHISEEDFENPEEMNFILETLKDSLI
jgi:hypothetical protein